MTLSTGECIKFERCENFRELGGYTCADGRRVKYGCFYRAPALESIKTEKDSALFNSLGIKHVFDFRSAEERSMAPDPEFAGITNHKIPARLTDDGTEQSFDLPSIVKMGNGGIEQLMLTVTHGYTLLPFKNPAYIAMFNEIKRGNTPILFHCTAGKDRTGVAAALILILLGVSEECAIEDFLITNTCRSYTVQAVTQKFAHMLQSPNAKEFLRLLLGVSEENLRLSFSAIKEAYASYDKYFEAEFDIDAQMRDKIKDMYLE